jgi:hypothetical protein
MGGFLNSAGKQYIAIAIIWPYNKYIAILWAFLKKYLFI